MIKLINARVSPKEYETFNELVFNTNERLSEYERKHPDLSFIIDQYPEENYIIVRTIKLEESAN